MNVNPPRITARVDLDTQELLSKAAALMGLSSINSFVLSAAIEKAKSVIEKENSLKLSRRDAMLFIDVLDNPKANARLSKALENYEKKAQ